MRKSQQKLAILVCVRIGVYRGGGNISNLVETYIKNTYLIFICCCTVLLEGIYNIASFGDFRGDLALFSAKFDGGDTTPTVPTRSAAPGCMLQVMCSGVT